MSEPLRPCDVEGCGRPCAVNIQFKGPAPDGRTGFRLCKRHSKCWEDDCKQDFVGIWMDRTGAVRILCEQHLRADLPSSLAEASEPSSGAPTGEGWSEWRPTPRRCLAPGCEGNDRPVQLFHGICYRCLHLKKFVEEFQKKDEK